MVIEIVLALVCVALFIVVARSGEKRKTDFSSDEPHPLYDQKQGNDLFQRAKEHLNNRRYKDALRDIDKALALEASEKSYLWLRARIYNALQQYREALADCETILDMDNTYHWAYAVRGKTYLGLKRYQDALEDFEQTLLLKPDFHDAHLNRIIAYLHLEKPEVADAIVNKLLIELSGSAILHARLAKIFYDFRLYIKSIGHASQAVAHASTEEQNEEFFFTLYLYIGWSHYYLKNYVEALEATDELEKLLPGRYEIIHIRSSIFHEQSNFDEAEKYYQKGLTEYPENTGLLYGYCRLLWRTYRYEESLRISEQLISLKESDLYYSMEGLNLLALHRFGDSLVSMAKAIDLKPENALNYHNRSVVYRKLKDYESAWSDTKKSVELNPNILRAYVNQAQLHLLGNDIEAALECSEKAMNVDPNDADGYIVRSLCFISQDEFKKAVPSLEKARNVIKRDEWAIDMLYALLEKSQGDIEQAQFYWKAAVDKLPEINEWEWFELEFDLPQPIMEKFREIYDEYNQSD